MMSILDTSLIAGSGFLVNLLSGRFLSTENYGLFIALYTFASLSLIFQSTLVSNPFSILSQSIENDKLTNYFSGTLLMTIGLGILLGIGSALGGLLYLRGVKKVVILSLIFISYIFFNLLQDFLRRYFYSLQQERQALLLDLISYGGQVTAILCAGHSLQLHQLFFFLTSTTILALLTSIILNRHLIFPLAAFQQWPNAFKEAFTANWKLGRWLLFSSSLSWTANQFYILALGLWQSPTVVAQLNAARTLAAASNPLVLAYEAIGLPRMAKALDTHGISVVKHYVNRTAVLGGANHLYNLRKIIWGNLFTCQDL